MIEFSLSDWQNYFDDHGVAKDLSARYLKFVEPLLLKNIPPIFELEQLSILLNMPLNELNKMILAPGSFYRTFTIPKRSGGKRQICSPYQSLLGCQHWIKENILKNVPIHSSAHGFVSCKSIISNASAHLGKKVILKIDIRDFFPSIPINWVIQMFKSFGYPMNVAYYLSSLCCLDGQLPQGAATSPSISNILSMQMDKRLFSVAKKFRIEYTRYADDLTFSGNYIPLKFKEIVKNIVSDIGFSLNEKKTRLKIGQGKKIVTGLSVSGKNLCIPKKLKRELRNDFHCIRKHGLLSHIANRKIRNPKYLESLLGKFAFWVQVEPENSFANEAKQFLIDLANQKNMNIEQMRQDGK